MFSCTHDVIHQAHVTSLIIFFLRVTSCIMFCAHVTSFIMLLYVLAVVGWVPVADDVGYVLLAKGDGSAGAKWRYRVVCRDGAFVRHGIELTSPFLFNLPWHSVVEVGLL